MRDPEHHLDWIIDLLTEVAVTDLEVDRLIHDATQNLHTAKHMINEEGST